jgi:transposase
MRFVILPGQRGETTGVVELMKNLDCGALLADKAYDADWLRQWLGEHKIEAVIPARKGRKSPAEHDTEKYKWRHLVENLFQKLKEFKKIAMRACKTDGSFTAMISLVASVIRLK